MISHGHYPKQKFCFTIALMARFTMTNSCLQWPCIQYIILSNVAFFGQASLKRKYLNIYYWIVVMCTDLSNIQQILVVKWPTSTNISVTCRKITNRALHLPRSQSLRSIVRDASQQHERRQLHEVQNCIIYWTAYWI